MGKTPIECLAELYMVVKKAAMDYDNHARAQTYFQTVLAALGDPAGDDKESDSPEVPEGTRSGLEPPGEDSAN